MIECCSAVEFNTDITEPLYSHTNKNTPNPIVEQTNVTFPYIVPVILLGLMVATVGDTKVAKHCF